MTAPPFQALKLHLHSIQLLIDSRSYVDRKKATNTNQTTNVLRPLVTNTTMLVSQVAAVPFGAPAVAPEQLLQLKGKDT